MEKVLPGGALHRLWDFRAVAITVAARKATRPRIAGARLEVGKAGARAI